MNASLIPGRIWTEAEIRAGVARLGKWFHNIDLKGVQTAPDHLLGDYPACKWRTFAHALPEDLSGKTVLDVGCNAGFYSLEMERRGAARVVSIDPDEDYLAQARFVAEVTGSRMELHRMSVYQVAELGERFDLVLFLGVAYHLRYPLLALDLLREHVAGGLLAFQSLLRGSETVARIEPDYPFSETAVFKGVGYPRLHFVEDRYAGDPTNWWIPNAACAEAMLRSAGFEILHRPEEEVFICRPSEIPAWSQRAAEEALAAFRTRGGGSRT